VNGSLSGRKVAKCSVETLKFNAILVAVYDSTNCSLRARVPLKAVLGAFPGHWRGIGGATPRRRAPGT